MKKLFLIASLLTAISCSHHNQSVRFNVVLDEAKANIGHGIALDIKVIDGRSNKENIGVKKFGEEKFTIASDQNLASFVQKEITQNLIEKGFKIGKEISVEIHIEKFLYQAKRKFFIGKSKSEAAIIIVIKNNKTGTKFTNNYSVSLTGKHFIAPLESTDSEIINSTLQDILQDILTDQDFIKALTS